MVDGPTLELYLLAILKAHFAINHVFGCMITGLGIAYAAFRAGVVPQQNIRLSGDYFHLSNLLAFLRRAPNSNHHLYGVPSSRSKLNMMLCGNGIENRRR
jgi:hypothetical protein